jgi:hypothetical protein
MLSAARRTTFVLACLLAVPAAAEWQEIDASDPFFDHNGKYRTPACSGAPLPGGLSPPATDADFKFFLRPGNDDKLTIFWDGGGSCWDANTCLGTAVAGAPLYTLRIDETTASLATLDGLGDFANPENPVSDATIVYIPYCTGDLHTGASDTEYTWFPSAGPSLTRTIHHRGADNTAAVIDYLTDYYQARGKPPKTAFLAGSSAGGYGVLYHYPEVRSLLPWHTKVRVLVDSANGIITERFKNLAIDPSGNWNTWANLAPALQPAFGGSADTVFVNTVRTVAAIDPLARIGQYATAFDAVQIAFYNIARHNDNPALWDDPLQLFIAGLDWSLRARLNMAANSLTSWNYRHYLGAGFDHSIVPTDEVYLETSAGGVAFIDWLDDMLNRTFAWGSDWRNVSCTSDCT